MYSLPRESFRIFWALVNFTSVHSLLSLVIFSSIAFAFFRAPAPLSVTQYRTHVLIYQVGILAKKRTTFSKYNHFYRADYRTGRLLSYQFRRMAVKKRKRGRPTWYRVIKKNLFSHLKSCKRKYQGYCWKLRLPRVDSPRQMKRSHFVLLDNGQRK